MGANPSYDKGPLRPVDTISWEDIQEFLRRLNQQLSLEGERGYRLPTEAEWEYAARAGRRQGFSGSEGLDQVGWYVENSQVQTHERGLKAPNEWGLYDMTGNLWEWCQDWYDEDYYQKCVEEGITQHPKGPDSGEYRVLRGGSWSGGPDDCRVAYRCYYSPDDRDNDYGFRLARTVWA